MKKSVKRVLQSLLLVPAIVLGVSAVAPTIANAADACSSTNDISGGISGGAACAKGTGQRNDLFGSTGVFTTITNVLLYIIGAVAVIMLIIGAIRYVTSGGDQSAVTAAKNTILYAIIGIIVALLAFAVVNFITNQISSNSTSSN